jgi:chorismate mutase
MDIADWRGQIDELDQQLVRLINQRAECALEIGRLKRNSAMPVYEPDRERIIFENIARNNAGPLSNIQLRQIFERLVDVMRQIQRDEMHTSDATEAQEEKKGAPELESRD